MNPVWDDKPKEACGVFGVYSDDPQFDVSGLIYVGLYALQHRGQESAGIVVSDGQHISIHKNMGLVAQVFNPEILRKLKGRIGIGHVRYSTTGSSFLANAQPLIARCSRGVLAVAHNGNLINTEELRTQLENEGSVFQTTTDTEVIMNLIARHTKVDLATAVLNTAKALRGAFAVVIMTKDTLIGLRDPYGVRPLCLGMIDQHYVLASESCAFTSIGAKFIRDVEPGEVVVINSEGLHSYRLPKAEKKALCVFEYIYFARPDSTIDGLTVHLARKAMGRQLAYQFKQAADVVIPVPDSGLSTALGFAEASGIPYDIGLLKNTYVGRTFIQPQQKLRDLGVRIKLNPVEGVIRGKRVVVIDDTIVRGTTTGRIIRMLRDFGATEVHMCISSPPITHPCYYGIDTSVRKELIAATHSVEEIRKYIGADTLTYLEEAGLERAFEPEHGFCYACFTGSYPLGVPQTIINNKNFLEDQ
ncbi:MAG TPA: amidophosphoribosyltransferase [Bacillota bacterium]